MPNHRLEFALRLTRAGVAADKLVELARQHGSVFLVGHGIMTMLIARKLRAWLGWPKRPVNNFWSFGVYLAAHARDGRR